MDHIFQCGKFDLDLHCPSLIQCPCQGLYPDHPLEKAIFRPGNRVLRHQDITLLYAGYEVGEFLEQNLIPILA